MKSHSGSPAESSGEQPVQEEGAQVNIAIIQARGNSREEPVGFLTFQKTEPARFERKEREKSGRFQVLGKKWKDQFKNLPTFQSHFYFLFCKFPY